MAAHDHDKTLLTPDTATDHIQGDDRAPVTLIEYGDFECPSCVQAFQALSILLPQYADQVRFVFRHFPLRDVHPHALLAAEAAEAAGSQGKFWPFHELLFKHHRHLTEKDLIEYAKQLELDIARFENDLRDHVFLQRVQEQLQVGSALGIRATPTFFVNASQVDVSFGYDKLRDAIAAATASRS